MKLSLGRNQSVKQKSLRGRKENLTPQGVNFINILCECFSPISFCQKVVKLLIFGAKILYEKGACKTLMKLTASESKKVKQILDGHLG